MDPAFWLERWQQNQIGFHQAEISAHLQDFWGALALPRGSSVFVPLCGKSRDMLWLRAQGHGVLGVELSPIAVNDFFRENGLAPQRRHEGFFERCVADDLEILCGDFFALTADQLAGVAGVYDRASLIALPADMRLSYARHLQHILPASAEILLITVEYPQAQMDGPPFCVHQTEVEQLYRERYAVTVLYTKDVLAENARFRERGLSALIEKVYRLKPRA
jgi:thiopurine S-methyltransferase